MDERRRSPRLNLALPVILRHRGRLIPATLINLSCGGMYLRSDGSDIASEEQVEIIFDLDQERRDLSLRGNIVRVEEGEKPGLGVQFSNVFSASHKALQHFLNRSLN